jgi:carbamoyl-phosphate synthase small subunit
MSLKNRKSAILMLSDGSVWKGVLAGAAGTVTGEICFNTGMTGYQEIFTDPSYTGQVVVMTHPHIGNYGIHSEESESNRVSISGMVCKNFSPDYSRQDAQGSLQDLLEKNGVTVIYDVDTRAIVRHIRDKGVMNCIISSEIEDVDALKQQLMACPDMEGLELSSKVCTQEAYDWNPQDLPLRVAAYDFGIKHNILKNLAARGCAVRLFPATAPAQDLVDYNPDGFFLSNGPGDPGVMDYAVANIKVLLQQTKPVFGICLGHQLIARAAGVTTFKMFNGHRGINHPVKNLLTGLSEITSQNHGFAVDKTQVEEHPDLQLTHVHLNDHTVAGIRFINKPVASVQFHPEAGPGPHDSRYFFDDFVTAMQQSKA